MYRDKVRHKATRLCQWQPMFQSSHYLLILLVVALLRLLWRLLLLLRGLLLVVVVCLSGGRCLAVALAVSWVLVVVAIVILVVAALVVSLIVALVVALEEKQEVWENILMSLDMFVLILDTRSGQVPGCILPCCRGLVDCSPLLTAGCGCIRCVNQSHHHDSCCPSGSGYSCHDCSLPTKKVKPQSPQPSVCRKTGNYYKNKWVMLAASVTSSVSTASITTVLVAPAGSITVVIALEATTAAAAEPTLSVVKAFLRGRASLAALLIVLL